MKQTDGTASTFTWRTLFSFCCDQSHKFCHQLPCQHPPRHCVQLQLLLYPILDIVHTFWKDLTTFCDSEKMPVCLMILLQTHQQYMTAKSMCMLIQTQLHNLQLIQFPSHCGKQNLRDLIWFLNAVWTACQMMSTAEEHPNILLHMIKAIIVFSHSQLMLSLQTSSLCSIVAKKSNNSSTSDKNSASFSKKELPRFSWATGQVYWKLLPMTAIFLIW